MRNPKILGTANLYGYFCSALKQIKLYRLMHQYSERKELNVDEHKIC